MAGPNRFWVFKNDPAHGWMVAFLGLSDADSRLLATAGTALIQWP